MSTEVTFRSPEPNTGRRAESDIFYKVRGSCVVMRGPTSLKKVCFSVTMIHALLSIAANAGTFTLGYITGSKRRPGNLEYQRPGSRISGALTLAVEEVNAGELGRRGHELDFSIAETYGEEDTSILVTADLWTKNVSVYIGPQETCVHEGRMATAFNIPMISYFCTHHETSRKDAFPTFARTRPPDTQISKSVVSVLRAFNWTRVTFMYMNSSHYEFNNKISSVATTILTSIESAGIIANNPRCWNEPYYSTHMNNPFHDLVESSYRETRIYVILGNYYEHMGLLMALDERKLLKEGEYWVVGVDIEEYDEKQPDKYLRGLLEDRLNLSILSAYKSYFGIVASAPIDFDNFTRLINEYRQRPPFNYRNPLANVEGVVQIVPETAYLYDAIHLYARSLILALDEGRDPRNGREMIAALRGLHYRSAMGYMVFMDENGDAEGNYTLIALDERPDKPPGLYPIGRFVRKEETTYFPKLQLMRSIAWIGDGPPLAEPHCGYYGEKCNSHTGEILGGVVGGLSLVLVAIFLVLYRNWRYEQELDSLLWKVNYKDIQIRETVTGNCDDSGQVNVISKPVRTSQVSLSSNPDADFRYSMIYTHVGFYKGRTFAVKKIRKKSIEITRKMKKELKSMRDLRHDNLNAFIGACTDPPNICIVVEYCPRGSLKDILENEDMKLDNMFMASLVGDIIRGMIYLHDSVIKYHGSLTTSNCLVDSRWVVKLGDFGLHEFKRDAEYKAEQVIKRYRALLYRAPEFLRTTRNGELCSIRGYQKGDVYSFAIVLYELHARHGPFGITELSAAEIIKQIIVREAGRPPFRPPIDQLENCFDFVRDCLLDCWSEDPESRPDFKLVRNRLRPLRKGMKPNIFDNMMAMMEKYANNLEALVDERTDQLSEEKKKTDALLYEMLPRYVAEKLKLGHKVEAESFDCVTIYFSDIVGFTAMSAESTPLQMVDFLNDLYTCFDSTIENFDVYKVETIGDAYMVVSGLPIRNGNQHASEIASMSLSLLAAIRKFSIKHRPLDNLQLRIGLHSGPVCAGVVGMKMPRYCLFGDTVNVASRMESTGSPLKIHCSQETKRLLDELGGFRLMERGVVSIKGKGEKLTYWLISEDPSLKEERSRARLARGLATAAGGTRILGRNANTSDQPPLPRSSLKHKSLLTRNAVSRCSRESPKRLRFASSDQLDQKCRETVTYRHEGSTVVELETIVDNSPCRRPTTLLLRPLANRGNCGGRTIARNSSSSCPCVEKLSDSETTMGTGKARETEKAGSSSPDSYLTRNVIPPKLFGYGSHSGMLQFTCKSAPSSPHRSSMLLDLQKRGAQSTEDIERAAWDVIPLIGSPVLN